MHFPKNFFWPINQSDKSEDCASGRSDWLSADWGGTNQGSVLQCLDQSYYRIALCGPVMDQYYNLWTNQSLELQVLVPGASIAMF